MTVLEDFEALRDEQAAITDGSYLVGYHAVDSCIAILKRDRKVECRYFDGNALGCTKGGTCECDLLLRLIGASPSLPSPPKGE